MSLNLPFLALFSWTICSSIQKFEDTPKIARGTFLSQLSVHPLSGYTQCSTSAPQSGAQRKFLSNYALPWSSNSYKTPAPFSSPTAPE